MRASFGSYFFSVAIVCAALTFYVYLRVSSLHLGYTLTQQRQEQLKLVLQNRELKTEAGMLSSPARLRSIAVQKLGMVPAERFVDLSEGAR